MIELKRKREHDKWDETMMPEEPFVYVSARSGGKTDFTEEVGDGFVKGKKVRVSLIDHELGKPVYETEATVVEVDKMPVVPGKHPFDWMYRIFFEIPESDKLEELCAAYMDPYVAYDEAFKKYMSHWGGERWSGLTAVIKSEDGKVLHKMGVDIFAPREKGARKDLLVYASHSHKPEFIDEEVKKRRSHEETVEKSYS